MVCKRIGIVVRRRMNLQSVRPLQLPAHRGDHTRLTVPFATVPPRLLQHRQVPGLSHVSSSSVNPLQHLQVPAISSGALTRPEAPPHHRLVPACGSGTTLLLIPGATVLPRPLQNLQVPAPGGVLTTLCGGRQKRAPGHAAVGAGAQLPVG